MDALVRYPDLRFVLCLHENVATGAAGGLARLTGWPALVNLHLSLGLANGLANIHNARKSAVPMVVTVGEHHTQHMLEDSALGGDIEGLAQTVCKWAWTVKDAGELAAVLHRATLIAMTPPQGPVCLILPTNVLIAPPRTPSGALPEIPALHLPQLGPAPYLDIVQAVEELLAAHHPLLLIGDIGPEAQVSVEALAELIGARVVYNLFPRRLDAPLLPNSTWLPYFPDQRRAFLSQADLLFLIGVRGFTTHFLYEYDPAPVVAPHTHVLHLDDDLEALGKNERSSRPLYGDIVASLQLLVTTLRERLNKPEQEPQSKTSVTSIASHASTATLSGSGLLSPKMLMQALRQVLPADTILVDEAVTARAALQSELLEVRSPLGMYIANRGGALGSGLPLAVGAQLGAPDQPVVAIVGDGSAMYTIQALWTAAHYQLPILAVICNNASYNIIKLEMLRLQGTLASCGKATLESVTGLGEPRLDFASLAEGMGVKGWTIRETADLLPNLKAALETCRAGVPALVDVHLTALPVPSKK
jgi:benzoylformate decarboxylase